MNGSFRLPVVDDGARAEELRRRMRSVVDRPAGTLMVHEIYASIQGESTEAGLPCTFIRLTGCPLRCRWCDTPHAFAEGTQMTLDEILDRVDALGPSLVEVTGGEPLAQPECDALLTALADRGRPVMLETSGALPTDTVDPRVVIILDMKCPSSGEWESNDEANLGRLRPHDQIKFVIGNRTDFDWAVDLVRKHDLTTHAVLFSPVFGELEARQLAEWILAVGINVRLQIALHKVIWDPKARGV